MLPSNPHKMPPVAPLAEMDGTGAEKPKVLGDFELGVVDSKPLLLALKEKAFRLSGAPVQSLAAPQYT